MARDIPQLQEIAGKVWKKEDELKQLKNELSALDRKIQLEIVSTKSSEEKEEYKITKGFLAPNKTKSLRI